MRRYSFTKVVPRAAGGEPRSSGQHTSHSGREVGYSAVQCLAADQKQGQDHQSEGGCLDVRVGRHAAQFGGLAAALVAGEEVLGRLAKPAQQVTFQPGHRVARPVHVEGVRPSVGHHLQWQI